MAEIIIDSNKYGRHIVLIDDEDLDKVSKFKWHLSIRGKKKKRKYATTDVYISRSERTKIYMHRLILNVTDPNIEVDHIEGDGLDNRKHNLRIGSHQQNTFNQGSRDGTSVYKGVTYRQDRHIWAAKIMVNSKTINIGHFKTEIEAAVAYNIKAKEIFGEFAQLNQVDMSIKPCKLKKSKLNRQSSYNGVCWSKPNNKWKATININGKQIYLGLHNTEQEAITKIETYKVNIHD